VRHALVTGAAGAIGSAIARELVRRDPHVRLTLVDVALERARSLASELGGDHLALAWDLAEPASLSDAFADLVRERESPDALVNCAGVMEIKSFMGTS
jgi:NAD(P)-dependent dehydrogenase (short-subunit alcohol dehydrogenase family)